MSLYPNLDAEMIRHRLVMSDVARALELTESTAYRILGGNTKLTLKRAKKIRDNLFPTLSLEYLFEEEASTKTA